ncbi:MAG: c-type cytochrome [Caldilineaceae bacterium]
MVSTRITTFSRRPSREDLMMFQRSGRTWPAVVVTLLGLTLTLLLAACAPNADAAIISPDLGIVLEAQAAGEEIAAVPTPIPPKLAEFTPEEILAGVPADLAEAIANADIANGPTLATNNGCIGCHALDPAVVMTGPTWHNVGDTALIRIPGTSPAEYLHQSIVAPGSFLVPGYVNVMPATYADTLSTEDLGTLIAYLLAQNGQP